LVCEIEMFFGMHSISYKLQTTGMQSIPYRTGMQSIPYRICKWETRIVRGQISPLGLRPQSR